MLATLLAGHAAVAGGTGAYRAIQGMQTGRRRRAKLVAGLAKGEPSSPATGELTGKRACPTLPARRTQPP